MESSDKPLHLMHPKFQFKCMTSTLGLRWDSKNEGVHIKHYEIKLWKTDEVPPKWPYYQWIIEDTGDELGRHIVTLRNLDGMYINPKGDPNNNGTLLTLDKNNAEKWELHYLKSNLITIRNLKSNKFFSVHSE